MPKVRVSSKCKFNEFQPSMYAETDKMNRMDAKNDLSIVVIRYTAQY
jgi:hypothetical protein